MRNCSREQESISSIEEARFFSSFGIAIVNNDGNDENECQYLKSESLDGERKCNTIIVHKTENYPIPDNRNRFLEIRFSELLDSHIDGYPYQDDE
jgi:hypothetical protein